MPMAPGARPQHPLAPLTFTVLPFSLELGGTSWHRQHHWTKRLPPYSLWSKAVRCS